MKKAGINKIEVLSSENQTVRYKLTSHYCTIGLDTEFLAFNAGKILWPDVVGLPQQRALSLKTTGDQSYYDFHGDGFATELCTKPDVCIEQLMNHVAKGFMWWGYTYGGRHNASFNAPSVYNVPKAVVKAASDESKKLGCMPSFNVYGDPGTPESLSDTQRTTGCHLHMSHPALAEETNAKNLVKWADILVGCVWTYISPEDPNIEQQRRKAYGRAGEFRWKDYSEDKIHNRHLLSEFKQGVEYRVLPGMVLHHPVYFSLMFNLYRNALKTAILHGTPDETLSLMAKDAINNADKNLSQEVINTIPFTLKSAALLRYLRRRTLDATNMYKWARLGEMTKGHQKFAMNEDYRRNEVKDV